MRILVTGAAGFIGSHLTAQLLKLGHEVIGLDDLSSGSIQNLHLALLEAGSDAEARFDFIEQDVCHYIPLRHVDMVYHLAAVGSVPRSLEKPHQTHHANVDGFFNVINLSRKSGVRRLIYASSSSVYGSAEAHAQCEPFVGSPLSPYAASKRINEIYAEAFFRSYQLPCVGLRFFNVYGPRQNKNGPYAAVIPKWIDQMKKNEPIQIFGSGVQIRDFTFVKDVTRALIFAQGVLPEELKLNPVFNVGTGYGTSLNELFSILKELIGYEKDPIYLAERAGDKLRSIADLTIADYALGYKPKYDLRQGLKETIDSL